MPRRKKPQRRELPRDHKYNSQLVGAFINKLMKSGKKSVAQKNFYDALDIIEEKTKRDGLEIFEEAIDKVKPNLEVRPRRVGGATYQVPIEVPERRQMTLAIRWLVNYSRMRSEHTMAEKLANEFIAASQEMGNSIKKKIDTYKMAKANKAFAHYRW
ncbi:30S ribosomal protein S7 [bacterium]|nr:30S ribosomal protein S7 [bacterium]